MAYAFVGKSKIASTNASAFRLGKSKLNCFEIGKSVLFFSVNLAFTLPDKFSDISAVANAISV